MGEMILVLVAVCIVTVAARPQSIVTSDMSLDMLPTEELDNVLDQLHHKHLTNIYNDYEEGLKMHEIHRSKIFHEHQRKRRKRTVEDHHDHDQLYEVSFTKNSKLAGASSSHHHNPPMNAFGETGFWQSAAPYTVPQSLWVEYYEPLRIVKFSFTSRIDNKNYIDTDGPSKYVFWASNWGDCKNESQWVILYEDDVGTPFTKSNDPKMAVVKNYHFYRCYGFKVTNVPGRDGIRPVAIANIHFYSDQELHEVSFAARGGIAKASSSHEDGNYPPMKAFGDDGFWHSVEPYTVPQSLWVEFPQPLRIVKYSFISRTDNTDYVDTDGPSKYIFWASNDADCKDESQWITLNKDDSGTPFAKSNDPKMELIENDNFYRCYGFKVTDVPGRDGKKPVTIAKIHLYTNLDNVDGNTIKPKVLFNDVWHNFIIDTGMNNREVVVIDNIKQTEIEVGDEIQIEKAFPLHFYHIGMHALFKGEDSHGYIIDNDNQKLRALQVCNKFTVSLSGCSCSNTTEEDPKTCACCILGGCLCDGYGIKDACVQCGKEEETCLTRGHQTLHLEYATAFTYHLDTKDPKDGYKTMFAVTAGVDVKFYTWNDGILMHKSLEDGRASLSFGSNFSQIAYADTFIDYKGDLIKKRFMFTFEPGTEGKQLYHELQIDPKNDVLRILSTRVWNVTGQFMKTIQSGGHIYILLCDYENEINLYDFRADKYRNFDPWFIHKFKMNETPLEIEIFTSHFEQILLITTTNEARIYKIKGNTFEHLQSLKPEDPITKFENIVPIKMKGCGLHEVLLAVEGTDAIPYVWNGFNENYTRLSGQTVPKDIYWSQAVSSAKYENSGEVVIPGKSSVLRLDVTGHLEELPNPVILLYEKVHKHLEQIEAEFDHQKHTMDETLEVISKSIHNSSIIHGTITIDSDLIHFDGTLHTNGMKAQEIMIDESLAGKILTNEAYKAALQQLKEDFNKLNNTVFEHEMVLLDAVPKNKIDEIKIKGTKTIKEGVIEIKTLQVTDLNVTLAQHLQEEFPLHNTINDLIRRDYPGSVKGRKTFSSNTTIFRLVTDFLDDIPVSDLVTQAGNETIEGAIYKKGLFVKENLSFSEDATAAGKNPHDIVCATNRIHRLGRCRFNNTLSVQGDLPVESGMVDGININSLVDDTLKKNSPSVLNKLLNISDFIIVEGNIVADSVMGINFTDLLENVVFKNKPANISGHLTYESDVTIGKSLFVDGLINNKSFPSDYPLASDSHIDFGNKSFEIMEADNITVQGLVDENKSEDFFTLTTDQTVNDTKVFDCGIDVIGDLHVGSGLIDGMNISSLKLISELNYTEIKTIVFKKNLTVETLDFTGHLNGFDFKEAVDDLVFCDEDEAIIDSVKTFNNLAVRYAEFHSNINNEKVSDFVTTDKDQTINGQIAFAEVTHFRSLDVDGTVDGVDIDSLFDNALYTDKSEQIVTGTKLFVADNITFYSMEMHEGINDVDFNRVFTKSGEQSIDVDQSFTNAEFENLEIRNILLRDSLLIDDVNIDDFLKNRLTTMGAQSIQGNIVIACWVNGTTLHSERINGYDIDDLVNNLVMRDATATIKTEVEFSSMEVKGPIKTKEQSGANGLSLAQIAANAFLLEGSENMMDYANFDHLEVDDIRINGLADEVDIERLINDAVFGDDTTNISVTGNKVFTSAAHVQGDIDTAQVNGLNYSSQLLLKKWDQTITSQYHFEDIYAMKDVILIGSFNEIDMEDFEKDAIERENVIANELEIELPKVNVAARGGIAKASSSHEDGNNPPMKAFGEAGFWHSLAPYTVPQSLWVEFPEPLRIVKYSFTSRTDNIEYVDTDGPSKYIFWASNDADCKDESQWITLNEDNSGTPFDKTNEPKTEMIENVEYYKCYGFKVTDVPGRDDDTKPVTIANIHLHSVIDSVHITTSATENGEDKWLGSGNGTIGWMDVNGLFNNLNLYEVYTESVCEDTTEITGKIKLNIPPEFSNLNIKTLNGTDFESVLSDVVFKNSDECIFEHDLKIVGGIIVNEVDANVTNIKGKLDGTDYEEIFKDAVYLSKNHNISSHWNFAGGAVINGNLNVEVLKDIPLTEYLTTHTPQNITHTLKFDKLTSDHVNVLGTVNGLNLTEEYRNTFFGTSDEIVTGNKTLQGLIIVNGDVHTNHTGRELKIDISEDTIGINQQDEVVIAGSLQFTSPLSVDTFTVNGSVNSVDLDEMFTNAWYNDEPTSLEVNMTFDGIVIMEGALNRNMSHTEDYDIEEIYEQGNGLIMHCKQLVNIIHSNFSETCDSTVHMYKLMENSIYDADYLQFVTSFKSAGVHRSSTSFILNGTNYILVNWRNNCKSSIYRWDTDTDTLIYDTEFESGYAYNWIVIPYADPNYVQLVMSSGWETSNCEIKNTTIWDLESRWKPEVDSPRINIQATQNLQPSIGVSIMGANYKLKLNLYNEDKRGIIEYISDENGDFEYKDRRKDEINKYVFGYNAHGSEIGFEVSVVDEDSFCNQSSVNVFENGQLLSSHILNYVILDALALEQDGKVLLMLLLKEPILDRAALTEDLYYITVYEYDFDDLLFVLMSYELVHGSGSLVTFTAGNEASKLVFITFIQDHGPIIIYNLLGETMKFWTELPIYLPSWSLPFNIREANGYDHPYLILGWDDTQEVIILTMEMRGFTVPPYNEDCIVPERNMTVMNHYYQYLDETDDNDIV